MRQVDHEIARLQVRHVGLEGSHLRLGRTRARNQFGGIEQVFRAEDRQLLQRHRDAAPDIPFHQVRIGDIARQVRAFHQVRPGGVGGFHAQLKGNPVFLEDVGQPFQFAVRGSEEHHAVALFHQVARFGNGHLHISVKGHRRPRVDVRGGALASGRGFGQTEQLQLAQLQFGFILNARDQFAPMMENLFGIDGRRAVGIFQSLPEALGGGRNLLRLI